LSIFTNPGLTEPHLSGLAGTALAFPSPSRSDLITSFLYAASTMRDPSYHPEDQSSSQYGSVDKQNEANLSDVSTGARSRVVIDHSVTPSNASHPSVNDKGDGDSNADSRAAPSDADASSSQTNFSCVMSHDGQVVRLEARNGAAYVTQKNGLTEINFQAHGPKSPPAADQGHSDSSTVKPANSPPKQAFTRHASRT
jgi:hypothetical protein